VGSAFGNCLIFAVQLSHNRRSDPPASEPIGLLHDGQAAEILTGDPVLIASLNVSPVFIEIAFEPALVRGADFSLRLTARESYMRSDGARPLGIARQIRTNASVTGSA
jgi:hypothetical protein